jgi:sugar (pentulose or hexulose) kinase
MDTRCQEELKSLHQEYQKAVLFSQRCSSSHHFTLPVLLVSKTRSIIIAVAWKVATIKDWFLGKSPGSGFVIILYRFGTGLLNLIGKCWDEEILSCAHVSLNQFFPFVN